MVKMSIYKSLAKFTSFALTDSLLSVRSRLFMRLHYKQIWISDLFILLIKIGGQ